MTGIIELVRKRYLSKHREKLNNFNTGRIT